MMLPYLLCDGIAEHGKHLYFSHRRGSRVRSKGFFCDLESKSPSQGSLLKVAVQVSTNAAGSGSLLGPHPGGKERDSSRHGDISGVICVGKSS